MIKRTLRFTPKLATAHEYNGWKRENQQVYDFVLRHFLATCSKPAVGIKPPSKLIAPARIQSERADDCRPSVFTDIRPGPIFPPDGPRLNPYFDNWTAQEELPTFEDGERFQPSQETSATRKR